MTEQAIQRVLVVDDELGMREGCRKILSAEGYAVEMAEDGMAGLELFKAHPDFTAALIDLNMPRMGGIELIEHLRSLDEDLVLFVITAYATIETAVEATRRGAYGYIPKPFTPDELLLPVRNGLERRALSIESRRLKVEREKRLLELEVERSKCSTIISCMSDGVLVVNRDRQIVLRNAAANRMIPGCAQAAQFAPVETLGRQELELLLSQVLTAPAGPLIASNEITLEESTYLVSASPVLEPSGEVSGAVAVLRDISPLKQLETAKSMFVSMVAHELKSPLASIESALDAILGGVINVETGQVRHLMEKALVRSKTLRTLVTDLLNLTAMETGRFTLTRQPVNLVEILQTAVENHREHARSRRTELNLTVEDDQAAKVLADSEALGMIFSNLIDNAIKYTPESGRVLVSLGWRNGYAQVTVQDNGIGMTPQEQAKVFDEFFRVKNAFTVHVPGTGLGLSLVKRLVEMHEGRITLVSVPKQGSTFAVSLPQVQ